MLWDDVRRLAELRLQSSSGAPQHFLGAIVLQQQLSQAGELSERTVIDGQQRLTTLQIVLDATGAVIAALGHDRLARQLDALTTNPEDYCTHAEDRFKVWPTNRDRAAYNEVMAAKPPVEYASLTNKGSVVVRAHEYFATEVEAWLLAEGDERCADRAEQLVLSLRSGLQIVVIDLRPDENSQEIFETLNARGTPLTAADLIKNFVFQRLALEHAAAEAAYDNYWSLFETAFWKQEISVGRYATPRSSLFLNQWLGARIGEEVSPRLTFSRFKRYVEHEMAQPMSELLPHIQEQAAQYQRWIERAAESGSSLSTVELFVYRTQVAELEFVKPILLWLHDPAAPIPPSSVDTVVSAVESWVMRRSLLRLPTPDLGRVVADLIKTCRPMDPATVGDRVTAYLARLDSASSYWPGDEAVREELRLSAVYRRYKRGRIRMFLEAVEDYDRGYTGTKPSKTGSRVVRGALDIEHVLPQNWRANWPVVDLAEEIRRDAHVHRLGNLTLLSGSLNSAVSDGSWLGQNGKRA